MDLIAWNGSPVRARLQTRMRVEIGFETDVQISRKRMVVGSAPDAARRLPTISRAERGSV